MGNETIASILAAKGHRVRTVPADAPVYNALASMAENGVAAVLVTSGGSLVGIISAKDYGRKVVLQGLSARDTCVGDIMTTSLVTASPEWTVADGLEVMTRHHIRHLPVLEDGRVVGVISMGDLVRSLISEQAFAIDQLHQYIGQKSPV
jgi:CBS domain-containing protein